MNNEDVILDQEEVAVVRTTRKMLLPWYIKMFAILFLIAGSLTILSPILFVVIGFTTTMSIYGLPISNLTEGFGWLVVCIYILKMIVSYAFLSEKKWAIKLAYVDAVIGVLLCITAMLLTIDNGFTFRLELLVLIPYLAKLFKMEIAWEMAAIS